MCEIKSPLHTSSRSLHRVSLVELLPMLPLPSPTTRVTSWCLSGQSWPSYLSARSGGNSWSSSTWGLSTSTPWCSTLGLASSTSWAFTSTSTSWALLFWTPCSTTDQMGTEHSLIRWIVELCEISEEWLQFFSGTRIEIVQHAGEPESGDTWQS